MKKTSKEDYIKITCKDYCENYETCDKSHIFIYDNGKTVSISCGAYKRRGVSKNES